MSDLLEEQYSVRAAIAADLERDLVGPSAVDELIADAPITRYIAGVLYPRSTGAIDPAAIADEQEDYDELGAPDPAISLANVRYPSSMGISFAVDPSLVSVLPIDVNCATYALESERGERPDPDAADQSWRRHPIRATLEVSLDQQAGRLPVPNSSGLDLFVRVRARGDGRGSSRSR